MASTTSASGRCEHHLGVDATIDDVDYGKATMMTAMD
jgi:hypothetical protein